MKFNFEGGDLQRVNYLNKLASLVLKRLNVQFTQAYLQEAIGETYVDIFESPSMGSIDGAVEVADRDDASNLAIVLLAALRKYHIKHEIVESVEENEDGILVILAKENDSQSYSDLLGVKGGAGGSLTLIGPSGVSVVKSPVENFVAFRKTPLSFEPGYQKNYRLEKAKQLLPLVVSIVILFALGTGIATVIQTGTAGIWIPELLLLIAGLVIAYNLFTLEHANFRQGFLSRRFCSANQKGVNCRAVLNSAGSKFLGIVSFTDIGALYFLSLFVFSLLGLMTNQPNQVLSVLFLASILPLPYTLYSVYYQAWVIKKACPLCIGILLVLWLQFLLLLSATEQLCILCIGVAEIVDLSLIVLIVAAGYSYVTGSNKLKARLSEVTKESRKYRNDPEVFEELSQRQKPIDEPEIEGGIRLGDPSAPFKLTAILSATCPPCASMFEGLKKLSDWFEGSLHVWIYLTPEPTTQKITNMVVSHCKRSEYKKAIEILSDWYQTLSHQKGDSKLLLSETVAKWLSEYPEANDHYESDPDYSDWFKQHFIPHTPALIFNSRYLPNEYYDLNLFGNILEKKTEQEEVAV